MMQNNNYKIDTNDIKPTFKVYDKEGLKKHIRIAFLAEITIKEAEWDSKLIVTYSKLLDKTNSYTLIYDSKTPFISDIHYMVSFQSYYNGQNYAIVRPNLFNTKKDRYTKDINETEQERIPCNVCLI